MKNKYKIMVLGIVFVLVIFGLFKSQILNYQKLVQASIVDNEINQLVIDGSKKMVTDNLNKYEKDETINITIKELVEKGYIDKNIVSKEKNIKLDDVVFIKLEDSKIVDVYIKNKSLINLLTAKELNDTYKLIGNDNYYVGNALDNYVLYNNELYRIVKLSDNKVYIIKDNKDEYVSVYEIEKYYKKNEDKIALTSEEYNKTIANNVTYLNKNFEYYLYDGEFNIINNEFGYDRAYTRSLIELDESVVVENGSGNFTNPLIISE